MALFKGRWVLERTKMGRKWLKTAEATRLSIPNGRGPTADFAPTSAWATRIPHHHKPHHNPHHTNRPRHITPGWVDTIPQPTGARCCHRTAGHVPVQMGAALGNNLQRHRRGSAPGRASITHTRLPHSRASLTEAQTDQQLQSANQRSATDALGAVHICLKLLPESLGQGCIGGEEGWWGEGVVDEPLSSYGLCPEGPEENILSNC
jgi:hypothetical protein|mmetsp:Transcript_52080/g.86825  ORF Transcript_52080/g.86825 Transcript_52080/m.86825 type:complete len:206 (-) Transcript_52080:100-717(-)|eukprot:CAMPEP_0174334766 /NCGR_PEP_ID=MMETSP0810-20121108/20192_1 /TAXON_ID=73025 ORGANISM="Eutreptiella gymnastica-like, Strain CCMP1594" /NCGR_SAMPLE_ID=MMETSP0810 /ASSEMBLY_ACC=CAM_ASM_000659 /LENGTH=205 /DNA_ID=CAMNT_0015452635 /DNA_START=1363 /DNA_END=1980 /DNA_ORIENTATION=-